MQYFRRFEKIIYFEYNTFINCVLMLWNDVRKKKNYLLHHNPTDPKILQIIYHHWRQS